jgi:hypothetical protein
MMEINNSFFHHVHLKTSPPLIETLLAKFMHVEILFKDFHEKMYIFDKKNPKF